MRLAGAAGRDETRDGRLALGAPERTRLVGVVGAEEGAAAALAARHEAVLAAVARRHGERQARRNLAQRCLELGARHAAVAVGVDLRHAMHHVAQLARRQARQHAPRQRPELSGVQVAVAVAVEGRKKCPQCVGGTALAAARHGSGQH